MNKKNTKKFERRMKSNASVYKWLGYREIMDVSPYIDINKTLYAMITSSRDKYDKLRIVLDTRCVLGGDTASYNPRCMQRNKETILLSNRYFEYNKSNNHKMGKMDMINSLAHELTHHYQDVELNIDMLGNRKYVKDAIFDELEFMAEVVGVISLLPCINIFSILLANEKADTLLNYDSDIDNKVYGGAFIHRSLMLSCGYMTRPYYSKYDLIYDTHTEMIRVLKKEYENYIPLVKSLLCIDDVTATSIFTSFIKIMEYNM